MFCFVPYASKSVWHQHDANVLSYLYIIIVHDVINYLPQIPQMYLIPLIIFCPYILRSAITQKQAM